MRSTFVLLCAALLCGCGIVYKLPTRQGNVIEQKQLDKLQLGMTREQVRFLLGTPIAATPLRENRWDYAGYYKNPRGKEYKRLVTLYFEGDKLSKMEGIKLAASEALTAPDLETLEDQEKKDKTEDERAAEDKDAGIVIKPK